MNEPLDIIEIIASSTSVRFDALGCKPECKKYHDFSVLRNYIKLYIKQHGDVYAIYKIVMGTQANQHSVAEKLIDSPKKSTEIQESIEKHTQSGLLQEIMKMHTLL